MPGSQLWHASTWRVCLAEVPGMWWQGNWAEESALYDENDLTGIRLIDPSLWIFTG